MLFMVIERFHNRDASPIYQRARQHGRMLPPGLEYVDSWVESNFDRCFQLMRTADPVLLQQWADNWRDLVDFEFVPVLTSGEAAAAALPNGTPLRE